MDIEFKRDPKKHYDTEKCYIPIYTWEQMPIEAFLAEFNLHIYEEINKVIARKTKDNWVHLPLHSKAWFTNYEDDGIELHLELTFTKDKTPEEILKEQEKKVKAKQKRLIAKEKEKQNRKKLYEKLKKEFE